MRASLNRASVVMTAVPVIADGEIPVAGAAPISDGESASLPPVEWEVLCATGVRASLKRESVVITAVPDTALGLIPVEGAAPTSLYEGIK